MNDFYNVELINNLIEYNKKRFDSFVYDTYFEKIPEYEKLLHSRIQKVSRIRERLIYLCSRYDYIWFCTFTFDNKYIDKCMRTKRDLVKSVLKSHDFKYILNVDYGKNTEREHYHCILATNIDFDVNQYFQSFYPCFSLSIPCKKGYEDLYRLSKYINKLVNHCIKATTNKQRLVYNFRGYDDICPTSYDRRIAYLTDKYRIINASVNEERLRA